MNDDELVELTEQTPPEEPVRAIRWHEMAASTLTDRADEHRWEAARLIAAELDSGTTQRELAWAIGKSVAHVNYMNRAWRKSAHLGEQDRPSFNEAYHDRGQRAGAERAELEDEIAKDPASVARIIQKAEELRPTPRKPLYRANAFDMSALRAASVKQRGAIEKMVELVHDNKIAMDDLSEEVDYIKVNLSLLTSASTDFDRGLRDILDGELP